MMGRITEAMINIRKHVEKVDVLILEDNNINHLPSRAFGSVQVNRLFLQNNRGAIEVAPLNVVTLNVNYYYYYYYDDDDYYTTATTLLPPPP